MRYISIPSSGNAGSEYLALSTEDGRIIFYRPITLPSDLDEGDANDGLNILQPVAQFGGSSDGLTGRIKDFEVLRLPDARELILITCGSDGTIRIWLVEDSELIDSPEAVFITDANKSKEANSAPNAPEPVGQLIGLYESRNRITCIAAFLMSKHLGHELLGAQDGNRSGRNEEAE